MPVDILLNDESFRQKVVSYPQALSCGTTQDEAGEYSGLHHDQKTKAK
jgi:hypothetical protein